jgi:hypothetical protein
LFRIRGDFDSGTVELAHGRCVLFFETNEPPANVWCSVTDDEANPSNGSATLVGASMVENGFYLYADVRSATVRIDWFVSEYN